MTKTIQLLLTLYKYSSFNKFIFIYIFIKFTYMNFLDFVKTKEKNASDIKIMTEAFKDSQLGKATKLICDLLKKETKTNIVSLNKFDIEINGNPYISEVFMSYTNSGSSVALNGIFSFNWRNTGRGSTEVYSISFYDEFNVFLNGSGNTKLTIETMGSSIVYFIPIIAYILKTKDYDIDIAKAKELSKSVLKNVNVKESELFIGALKYKVFEGLSDKLVMETYNHKLDIIAETEYEDMLAWRREKQKAEAEAKRHKNDSPDANAKWKELQREYAEIRKAIAGGAGSISEVEMAVKKALSVKVNMPTGFSKVQQEIEKARKDPNQVFKEMYKYIKMVAKGLVPSLIICGAPGVGKTWKTTNLLKSLGYEEDVNMYTIKGKCTPRRLYLHLYDFQDKNNIVLIDDADALVGPKAPEDCINILKAALDSTSSDEGRLVSYGVGGKLQDDDGNDVPKKFYYRGGVIVLTNYNAGQLDTAFRGRSYVQDIYFTPEQVLQIIRDLMPTMDVDRLSAKAKMKAYDYLMELYEAKMLADLSIRTFGLCATMFQANMDDPDFTEEDTKSMIKEQMINQALRGGKKY